MECLVFKNGRDRKVIIDKERGIVIKIATNENGLLQNYNEFVFNKKRPDITAEVKHYAGEYLIMEWVDTTIPNLCCEHNEAKNKKEKERNHKWLAVYNELERELGSTLDNGQIGETLDGRVVAYDYGHTEEFINKTIALNERLNQNLKNYILPKTMKIIDSIENKSIKIKR